ncbi:endoplasmic reticulum membrane sensor NFE2L1a [Tachysurus fulvidraco]|uniref:endoplasmic reticulum membrane sensor NFE2L1a n=1 Tax=Tachysurus fulvidraco TaxID=1234273 RepID=UPI001FEEAB10|nr:endoplasmic reticulum membrane sensor NFE2L1a [Tachysurus fulvidraco]XP_026994792.2 endoplasmic reticulum membrane sensor NFE2L1a [Tachysurus fulvidraco]XP_026994794.2 endoplasmic reticulum membrane sensor NFE2L1a [Tachysurus fulvidraco]XP_026994795.2 endoplasmic reticulum membrane sensor NFE2L1a [Tachysurus fulvidraco]
MQPLKKYFTEGLIQVAIVLSLAGIHVDVDPYLPPNNINIESPDLTQFSKPKNSPQGYGLHMKSPDVASVPAPRLMHWVRSLPHLNIPSAQLEAWLVHSESDNSGMTLPSLTGSWDGGGDLVDMEDSASLTLRMGGGGIGELGNDPFMDDGSLRVVTTHSRSQMDSEDVKEEVDEFSIWQQEFNQNMGQDQLLQGQNQYFSLINEDDEDELMMDGWRHANPFCNPLTGMREDVQFTGLQEDNSLSTEECLRLLEAGFPLGHEQYLTDLDPVRMDEDPLQHHRSLYSTLLSQQEPVLDLEEQWQDVLSVLGPQDTNGDDSLDSSHSSNGGRSRETRNLGNPIQQNLSLDQPSFSRSSPISFASETASRDDSYISNQDDSSLNVSNSSNVNLNFNDPDIIDFLLSPTPESSNGIIRSFSVEELSQLGHFRPLLEESMFGENSLLDLTLDDGSDQSEVPKKEDQTDSDSGLSLDYSQSPASPSRSESSCCSSSSSVSSTYSFPETGAVGYTPIKEELMDEEGAVGGYTPELNKMDYTNYTQFQYSPWFEHIGHDHTYNHPHYTNQRKPFNEYSEEPLEYKLQEDLDTKDEKRARAMRIPFSTDHIINLPVEEFNELLAKHRLSEAQLALIRDIRRRGKNKVAAQNCRRRKIDILQDLEHSVDGLQRHRTRLLREKLDVLHSVREMKQRLNDLYQEVRSRLREVDRIPCSAMEFALQPGNDDHVSKSRRKSDKKQKDKE